MYMAKTSGFAIIHAKPSSMQICTLRLMYTKVFKLAKLLHYNLLNIPIITKFVGKSSTKWYNNKLDSTIKNFCDYMQRILMH